MPLISRRICAKSIVLLVVLCGPPVLAGENGEGQAASIPIVGRDWTVPELGMEMVAVVGGTFHVGPNDGYSVENDGYSVKKERREHTVRFSWPFWLAKYEVTQREYKKLTRKNPSYFKGSRHPVAAVSWNDAMAFCRQLTEQERRARRLPEGYEYRLPTEGEWVYAARGGARSEGFTYSGSNDPKEVAWSIENSGRRVRTVGGKKANELGLYDMSGNVFEWCLDWWYNPDYRGKSPDAEPKGPPSESYRAIRGGCVYNPVWCCRTMYRSGLPPTFATFNIGFRVSLGPILVTRQR